MHRYIHKQYVQHFSYQNDSYFYMKKSCAVIFHMNDGDLFIRKTLYSIFHIKMTLILI